jgi:hypothetical protein
MKKLQIIAKTGIALAVMSLMVMFAGCPQATDPTVGDEAILSSVTVANVEPEGDIPTPITKEDWDDNDVYLSTLDGVTGYVYLPNQDALTDAAIKATASSGAKIAFGMGDDSNRAAIEFNKTSPITFNAYEFLYIRVTSEDGKTVNYYRFQILTVSTNANLSTVTIADVNASVGTGVAVWSDATAGSVSLSNTQKAQAKVEAATSFETATVKFAKVTGDGEPVFGDTDTFDVADGDFIYIEVTAADGETKLIYKVEVWIGRNADLDTITFTNAKTPPNTYTVGSKGTGDAVLDTVVPGYVLFTFDVETTTAYTTVISPEDPEATIKYVVGAGTGVTVAEITTTYSGTSVPIAFTDQQYLYVEVTSANEKIKNYYKIQVNFRQTTSITAGSPEIKASTEKYIDPLWDSVTEVYQIKKIWTGDSTSLYRTQGPNHPRYTTAVAKAMWDYDGLYVYVDVTDSEVTSGSSSWTTSNAHQYDSFELFINEDFSTSTSTPGTQAEFEAHSGQYRVGADGRLSGHAANALAAFQAFNKASAWKTNTGYVIVMQAPWLHGAPSTDTKIGFELQVNACTGSGDRDGVMVWNNIAHSNYQTNSAYGEATLTGTPIRNAQRPVIATQPFDDYVALNQALDLSVTASVTDGGTLSYKWYKATASGQTGTEVGTDNATYTADTSTTGVNYYYVVVTNTNNDVNGTKVVSVTSNYAKIEVGNYQAPENWEEKITITDTGIPVYGFSLPGGKTFGDYDRIVFKLKMDPESPQKDGRLRAWGNYNLSTWTNVADKPSMGNAAVDAAGSAGNKLLNANPLADYSTVTDWTEQEIELTTFNALAADAAIKKVNGLIAIGFGLIANNDGSKGTRIYYVKDIVLANSDKSETVPAIYPEHPRLWGGDGASAHVFQDSTTCEVTRELQ